MNTFKPKPIENIFFTIGVVASSLVVVILFFVWNRPKAHLVISNTQPLINYNIDKCEFSKGGIKIDGWAFIPGEVFALNQVFALKSNGDVKGMITSLVFRDDVSKVFGKNGLYSRSGFSASRLDNGAVDEFRKEIIITSTSKNGITYAAKYTCK